MTWDGANYIMEFYVDGSPNVRLLRLKRTGKDNTPISQAEQFKVTLGTTEHYQEVMGQMQTTTVTTVPEAEAWIREREEEGGVIDHSGEPDTLTDDDGSELGGVDYTRPR